MQVFRFNFRHESNNKILYMGIQYIATSPFHWRLLDKLALNTLHEVVLPIYPKAPEYHLEDTYNAIKEVYDELVAEVGVDHIVIMGDGSGGISYAICTILN